jgi:hypothetical protein
MKGFFTRTVLLGMGLGLLLGFGVFALVRFATYSPEHTHYHANFAVYINGERQEFKGMQYYEDVAACSAYEKLTPKERVHMHGQVNDSVHVHDDGVTWGAFFQNLGWNIDTDFIKTDEKLYLQDDTNKITFILNGDDLPSITNTEIGDEDRLLISYGPYDTNVLEKQFESTAHSAHDLNQKQDPASCSGSEAPSLNDRVRHIFDRG